MEVREITPEITDRSSLRPDEQRRRRVGHIRRVSTRCNLSSVLEDAKSRPGASDCEMDPLICRRTQQCTQSVGGRQPDVHPPTLEADSYRRRRVIPDREDSWELTRRIRVVLKPLDREIAGTYRPVTAAWHRQLLTRTVQGDAAPICRRHSSDGSGPQQHGDRDDNSPPSLTRKDSTDHEVRITGDLPAGARTTQLTSRRATRASLSSGCTTATRT